MKQNYDHRWPFHVLKKFGTVESPSPGNCSSFWPMEIQTGRLRHRLSLKPRLRNFTNPSHNFSEWCKKCEISLYPHFWTSPVLGAPILKRSSIPEIQKCIETEQGLTSHQTHYRSYRRRFLKVIWPNQLCQSTEGNQLVLQIRPKSHQDHSTMLQ